jgi:hypothetical protein
VENIRILFVTVCVLSSVTPAHAETNAAPFFMRPDKKSRQLKGFSVTLHKSFSWQMGIT